MEVLFKASRAGHRIGAQVVLARWRYSWVRCLAASVCGTDLSIFNWESVRGHKRG